MTLNEYQLKYGELTPSLKHFFMVCARELRWRRIPTPSAIHRWSFGAFGPKLNGRQSKLRIQIMKEFGCTKVNGRWKLP